MLKNKLLTNKLPNMEETKVRKQRAIPVDSLIERIKKMTLGEKIQLLNELNESIQTDRILLEAQLDLIKSNGKES